MTDPIRLSLPPPIPSLSPSPSDGRRRLPPSKRVGGQVDDVRERVEEELREEQLRCVVCMEVISSPMLCVNAHTTCAPCLRKMREEGRNDCPVCRMRTQWTLNRGALRTAALIGMRVRCGNKGCHSPLPVGDVDDHRLSCPHRLFSCPLHPDEMGESFSFPELVVHLSQPENDRQVVLLRSGESVLLHCLSDLTQRVILVDEELILLVHIHPSWITPSTFGSRSEFVLRVGGIATSPSRLSDWSFVCSNRGETISQVVTSSPIQAHLSEKVPFVSRLPSDLFYRRNERDLSPSAHEVFSTPPSESDVRLSAQRWADVLPPSYLPPFYESDDVREFVSLSLSFLKKQAPP